MYSPEGNFLPPIVNSNGIFAVVIFCCAPPYCGANAVRMKINVRIPALALRFMASSFLGSRYCCVAYGCDCCSRSLPVAHILVETIQVLIPESPIVRNPGSNLMQWCRVEPAEPPLCITPSLYQSCSLQHAEVLGNSRPAHIKWLRQLTCICVARRQPREDRSPGRIGKCGERRGEMVRHWASAHFQASRAWVKKICARLSETWRPNGRRGCPTQESVQVRGQPLQSEQATRVPKSRVP